ncbi:ArsR family transcriptional regulator [Weissella confusa]|uniref:Metalloregulator ArsR/SmtB family transcription factor n=1 Tax=Weissella confusa TaxID=1583 RepID=A0AAJ3DBM1_WEICO|nr:metalloregulator ArsR/SmtB family transcription factor [Weissella confusa]MBJ7695592.1 winged helix-turn-helix transcriptional regulator [Weissella confusa]NBA11533.1 metalloregulator ArsR/SmtB family transcription factor [Weissella confusa]QBZ05457.1 ArsR family transcriptional regulator [Weissella confusa]
MELSKEILVQEQEALKIAKLLANDLRLQILCLLQENGAATVTEIMNALHVEQSRVSHQLSELREYQMISATRSGRQITYALTDPHMMELLNDLLEHANHVRLHREHGGI